MPYPDGTMVVRVNDDVGTTFYVKWKNRTLVIDINDITTTDTFESMQLIQVEYKDLDLGMIELEEEVEVWGSDEMSEAKFNQLVKSYAKDICCPALVEDFRILRDIFLKEIRLARRARAVHRFLALRPAAKVAKMITNGFMKNVPIEKKIKCDG